MIKLFYFDWSDSKNFLDKELFNIKKIIYTETTLNCNFVEQCKKLFTDVEEFKIEKYAFLLKFLKSYIENLDININKITPYISEYYIGLQVEINDADVVPLSIKVNDLFELLSLLTDDKNIRCEQSIKELKVKTNEKKYYYFNLDKVYSIKPDRNISSLFVIVEKHESKI